jgi:hypothetical protein
MKLLAYSSGEILPFYTILVKPWNVKGEWTIVKSTEPQLKRTDPDQIDRIWENNHIVDDLMHLLLAD